MPELEVSDLLTSTSIHPNVGMLFTIIGVIVIAQGFLAGFNQIAKGWGATGIARIISGTVVGGGAVMVGAFLTSRGSARTDQEPGVDSDQGASEPIPKPTPTAESSPSPEPTPSPAPAAEPVDIPWGMVGALEIGRAHV